MPLFYHIGLRIYSILLWLASLLGHRKASLWITGRKNWEERLRDKFKNTAPSIWIHCASLGEYELSVPLIKAFKKRNPAEIILVTFFSPSGFEVKKQDPLVFHVDYLPVDSPQNAHTLIQITRPKMAFFAKYDFWFHYLNALKKQTIPTYLFSASFRPSQVFFKSYGTWYRKMLHQFTMLFVIDESSADLLKSHNITSCMVTGDTRYDRVSDTFHADKTIAYIDEFKHKNHLLIAGSTWPEDENVLIPFINKSSSDIKLIIAPHEISEAHLQGIEEKIKVPFIRYSQLDQQKDLSSITVLIIDNIGLLASLYKYGDIAYIGGAFKQGLHNILEPLSFGLPVLFGPVYKRYPEAISFIEEQGAFSIHDTTSFEDKVLDLLNKDQLHKIKESNRSLMEHKVGATDKIMNTISWQN